MLLCTQRTWARLSSSPEGRCGGEAAHTHALPPPVLEESPHHHLLLFSTVSHTCFQLQEWFYWNVYIFKLAYKALGFTHSVCDTVHPFPPAYLPLLFPIIFWLYTSPTLLLHVSSSSETRSAVLHTSHTCTHMHTHTIHNIHFSQPSILSSYSKAIYKCGQLCFF